MYANQYRDQEFPRSIKPEWHLRKLRASGTPALQALVGCGALERAPEVPRVRLRTGCRRVRLRTVPKRSPDPCAAITLVRKRTLPDAVESTVFDLAEFIRAKPVKA